jgi:hypothetical protein
VAYHHRHLKRHTVPWRWLLAVLTANADTNLLYHSVQHSQCSLPGHSRHLLGCELLLKQLLRDHLGSSVPPCSWKLLNQHGVLSAVCCFSCACTQLREVRVGSRVCLYAGLRCLRRIRKRVQGSTATAELMIVLEKHAGIVCETTVLCRRPSPAALYKHPSHAQPRGCAW